MLGSTPSGRDESGRDDLEPGPVSEGLQEAASRQGEDAGSMAGLLARRRAAVAAYLAALTSHDPAGVPFARRCLRLENGIPTGFTGADLRAQLRWSPAYRIVRGLRDEQITSIGDRVHARFVLDTSAGPLRSTVEVSEWFWFDGGRITRIEARIRRLRDTAD